MKQKTALAQLAEKIDRLWENDHNFSVKLWDEITSIIEELKPLERQQIEDFARDFAFNNPNDEVTNDFFDNNLTQE